MVTSGSVRSRHKDDDKWLRINGDRLWDTIHEIAEIGPGVRGGNNRQALTDEDGEGQRLFQHWCEDAGMSVKVDAMGTMFTNLVAKMALWVPA